MATLSVNQRGGGGNRRSYTTSPAIPITTTHSKNAQGDARDQWDIQLGSVVGGSNSNFNNNNNSTNTPGHSPATAAVANAAATRARAMNNNNNNLSASSPAPPVTTTANNSTNNAARFVKEQMIRAAVSAMIQCNVAVSPALLDFRNKTDAQLDETLASVNASLSEVNKAQPRCPVMEREIYFDPQLIGGGGGNIVNQLQQPLQQQQQQQQQPRPHAPVGHIRSPPPGTVPSTAVGGAPSPTIRFATPALSRPSTNNQTPASGFGMTPIGLPNPERDMPPLATPTATAPSSHGYVGSPPFGGYQQQQQQQQQQFASTSTTTAPTTVVVAPTPTHALVGSGALHHQHQHQQQHQQQQSGAAVKPKARRAPYDPRMFPREVYDAVSSTAIANVRKHIARSASSAFSQHSTQSSTLTQTATPSPPRQNSDAFFVRNNS